MQRKGSQYLILLLILLVGLRPVGRPWREIAKKLKAFGTAVPNRFGTYQACPQLPSPANTTPTSPYRLSPKIPVSAYLLLFGKQESIQILSLAVPRTADPMRKLACNNLTLERRPRPLRHKPLCWYRLISDIYSTSGASMPLPRAIVHRRR